MDPSNYAQDPRLSADSRRKFAEYLSISAACFSPTTVVSQLHDRASKRPGNKDPFLTWWKGVSDAQMQLALENQTAVFKFKSLEAQLDGSMSKVEEWKEQYDVTVNAMGRWALEQQKTCHGSRQKFWRRRGGNGSRRGCLAC